jgi:hypothetical protein
MSDVKDMLFRDLAIAQRIPRMPCRVSTPSLQEKLKDRGFDVRSHFLQRELRDKLSVPFSNLCHEDGRPYRWSLEANANTHSQALDPVSAPALSLTEGQLAGVLPQLVSAQWPPHFRPTNYYLQGMDKSVPAQWHCHVRAIAQTWLNEINARLHRLQTRYCN